MAMPQTTIVFDTHEAVHQLTAAGVPERQAEAHVRLQAQLIEQNFATKPDIEALRRDTGDLRRELKTDIETLRRDTEAGFEAMDLSNKALEAELRTDMGKLDTQMAKIETQMAKVDATVANRLTDHFKWLVGTQIALAAIILAALKLF